MLKWVGKLCWRKHIIMTNEREARLQRLHTLREQGIEPYPNNAERTHTIAEVLEHFDEWQGPEGAFTLVGRLRLQRPMGKSTFAQIEDGSGRIQIYYRINDMDEVVYHAMNLLEYR